MIYNENGIIINEGYQLDILINEGFSDIANAGLKGIHTLIRKLIDAVQNTIEYASRIPYSKIIKNINSMSDEEFNKRLTRYSEENKNYFTWRDYDKWMSNFNEALSQLKNDNTLSLEDINKILYNGKTKEELFGVGVAVKVVNSKNDIPPNNASVKKIVTSLQDFTKPLRKSYSELKVLNTNINKGMRISSEVMKEIHSYCITAISEYREMSKAIIRLFKNPLPETKNDVDKDNTEPKITRTKVLNKAKDENDKKSNSEIKSEFFQYLGNCKSWYEKRDELMELLVTTRDNKFDAHTDMNDQVPDIKDIDEKYLNTLEKNLKKNFSKTRLEYYKDALNQFIGKNPKDTKFPLK